MVPALPQELIDQILDHFSEDKETLSQCGIVCRAWVPTAQMHLFHDLALSGRDWEDLADVFQRHDLIPSYIQKVELDMAMPQQGRVLHPRGISPPDAYSIHNFIQALSPCSAIKELTLVHLIEKDFRKAEFGNIMITMTHLTFDRVRPNDFADILPLISKAKHLQSLHITGCEWHDNSMIERIKLLPSPSLAVIDVEVDLIQTFIEWICHWHSQPLIHTLKLTRILLRRVPLAPTQWCRDMLCIKHLTLAVPSGFHVHIGQDTYI